MKWNRKTRLNLEFDEAVREKIENLQRQTRSISLVEVIRRAIAVYDFLTTKRAEGYELLLRNAKGETLTVVVDP